MLYIERRRAGEELDKTSYIVDADAEFDFTMLPIYTSPEGRTAAMTALASTLPDHDYVGFEPTSPFELLETIEWLKKDRLEILLFDPLITPDGELWITGHVIPVAEYVNAIEDIYPLVTRLDAEAKAQFYCDSHLKKEPFVRWRNAHAEDIVADLRAQMEELTACDDR